MSSNGYIERVDLWDLRLGNSCALPKPKLNYSELRNVRLTLLPTNSFLRKVITAKLEHFYF